MGLAEEKRVVAEYEQVNAASDRGFTAKSAFEDFSEWTVTIPGPADTPYAGGTFKVDIAFPSGYPDRSPMLEFITKIYHPNINKDRVQLTMVDDRWENTFTPLQVLEELVKLLKEPQLADAVEKDIAEQYEKDRAAFDQEAKKWTTDFAQAE